MRAASSRRGSSDWSETGARGGGNPGQSGNSLRTLLLAVPITSNKSSTDKRPSEDFIGVGLHANLLLEGPRSWPRPSGVSFAIFRVLQRRQCRLDDYNRRRCSGRPKPFRHSGSEEGGSDGSSKRGHNDPSPQ